MQAAQQIASQPDPVLSVVEGWEREAHLRVPNGHYFSPSLGSILLDEQENEQKLIKKLPAKLLLTSPNTSPKLHFSALSRSFPLKSRILTQFIYGRNKIVLLLFAT